MSYTKDIIFDIQDEIERGDLSFAEIAVRYDVPMETVQDIFDDMCLQEQDYEPDYDDYDGQPTEYDEWMSFDPDC